MCPSSGLYGYEMMYEYCTKAAQYRKTSYLFIHSQSILKRDEKKNWNRLHNMGGFQMLRMCLACELEELRRISWCLIIHSADSAGPRSALYNLCSIAVRYEYLGLMETLLHLERERTLHTSNRSRIIDVRKFLAFSGDVLRLVIFQTHPLYLAWLSLCEQIFHLKQLSLFFQMW